MPAERAESGPYGHELRVRGWADRAIAELAAEQHGVVTIDDLRRLGISYAAVQHRIARGALHRIYRGVYAVGHPILTRPGRWLAAVFAAGTGAVLSHRAAAEHHVILDHRGRRLIDVSAPQRPSRHPGLRIHEVANLTHSDRMVVDRIPVTTVARTLLDLAASEPRALEYAFAGAERRGLLDLSELDAVIERSTGRRGVARARLIRAEFQQTPEFARSQDERRFLTFCRRYGIQRPKTNLWVSIPNDGFEVDFSWPEQRLIVEMDSSWHDDTLTRKRDAHRDRALTAAGWLVIRLRRHHLTHAPEATAARIKALLARRTRS
jgi:hypothetical protein